VHQNNALTCQRELFSLPEDLHYFNGAAASPLSKAVEAAGQQGLSSKNIPLTTSPEYHFGTAKTVRQLFAKLIKGDASRVALIPAASYGVATVAKNVKLDKGQNIVLLHEQFPSNVLTWHKFQNDGVEIRTVKPPQASPQVHNRAQAWNAEILEAIDQSTGLVALGHIHWADGSLFDLEAISKKAKSVGAVLVIDGTQSVGALPFDVQKIQPDALVVSGYKWLMSSYGMGCAYYGERFDNAEPLEESYIARKNSSGFAGTVDYSDGYVDGAARFDVGQKHNPILLPMLIQALTEVLERQPTRIQDYCQNLMQDALTELQTLGYGIEDSQWRAQHLFGLRPPEGLDVDGLKETLDSYNIITSLRGPILRISPNVYNNESDVQKFKQVLLEALA